MYGLKPVPFTEARTLQTDLLQDESMSDNLHQLRCFGCGPGLRALRRCRLPLRGLRRSVRSGITQGGASGGGRIVPTPRAQVAVAERKSSAEALDHSGVWRSASCCRFWTVLAMPSRCSRAIRPCITCRARRRRWASTSFFAKHQGMNPTGSFKDTGMTAAMSVAKERGFAWVPARPRAILPRPWLLMRRARECAAWC